MPRWPPAAPPTVPSVEADVVKAARRQTVASAQVTIGNEPYLLGAARLTEAPDGDPVLVLGRRDDAAAAATVHAPPLEPAPAPAAGRRRRDRAGRIRAAVLAPRRPAPRRRARRDDGAVRRSDHPRDDAEVRRAARTAQRRPPRRCRRRRRRGLAARRPDGRHRRARQRVVDDVRPLPPGRTPERGRHVRAVHREGGRRRGLHAHRSSSSACVPSWRATRTPSRSSSTRRACRRTWSTRTSCRCSISASSAANTS